MNPVNYLTEADIRRAHDEGRLRIPLSQALECFNDDVGDTHLLSCIAPTKAQKEAAVRYTPPEIIDIMKYIAALLPRLPPELQAHTDVEVEYCRRIPYITAFNPDLHRFQCGYPGIFLCVVRAMSSPAAMVAALDRTRVLLSMHAQGMPAIEASQELSKAARVKE
jgi:hypothetical protein